MGRNFGVDTGLAMVHRYLGEFKQYVFGRDGVRQAVLLNINRDIGPNSLEILSYLRP